MMKQRQIQTLGLWAVLLLCASAFAQAPAVNTKHEFSVKQAVDFAVKNNVQVKNALLEIQLQKQVNREITAAALPTISGNIALTDYFDIPTQVADASAFGGPAGTFSAFQFGLKYSASGGLQLQQLLFDGQVFVGLQARKTSMDFRVKNVEVTEEAIRTNINKVYYQLVVSKTQTDLIDANITRLEKLQHDTKELYKNGFVEKLDVDKISVQIANLQTQKSSILSNIENGYSGLKFLMGMPVKDTLLLTDTISEAQIKEGILQDAAYQYLDRKDYQYAQLGKKLNEYNIKRYKLAYLPTLSMAGAYSKQAYRPKFTFFEKGDWYPASYVSFNLSVPIFSGFAKDAKVQQARLELQKTDNTIDNLKRSIDNDVAQATINFKAAIATIDNQRKNMELAETVYNQTKKKYEIGTGSNTEITSAQTDLIAAQTNYINALYSAIIAKVDYTKAIGKL